jgi:long-subunit fatty acid transport protein
MLSRAAATALVVAAVAWARPAAALNVPNVYDNAQGIPIGSKAAGMGGAYTALACDEASLHYNVASLACAHSSHLELSANAYVIQGALARGELGRGQDVSAVTFHSVPSIVGAVRVINPGSERTRFATYPGRLSIGFSVSLPSSIALRIDPPHPSDPNIASFNIRDDLTAGDLGVAYQFNREIAVGFSLGAVLRTADQNLQWLLVKNTGICPVSGCPEYVAYDATRSYTALGLRNKLGVLFRPIKNFSFGLSVNLPTLHVLGSATENATYTRADGTGHAIPVRTTGTSEVDLPLRIALGMAYAKKRYTFTGDVSLNFPREVRYARGMEATAITGVTSGPTPPDWRLHSICSDPVTPLDRCIHPTFQPNVNIGASIPFGPTKELNIGFFTDFSSVSTQDVVQQGSDRVHMFGGSMTLGLLGKQSRVWVGTSGEVGHTTTRVPGKGFDFKDVSALPLGDLPNDGTATLVRWTLVGILGSNYSFGE